MTRLSLPTSVLPYSSQELQEMSALACSKTLQTTPELVLTAAQFCQPVDIGIDMPGDTTKEIPNMAGYPTRSVENALSYIHDVVQTGIRSIMIRMDAPAGYTDKNALLERQAAIVRKIRGAYDTATLDIILDPFSVALNSDKTWGIRSKGQLNYLQTAELFSRITSVFADAGAGRILTLGRFEREVDVAHRTLQNMGSSVSVSSFSTNTETANAYVYADHGAYALTKQKILVTNYHEMVFRAIVDIYEGSSLVIVKPAENLHVLEKISTLINHPALLHEFLESKRVKAMVHQSVYLDRIRRNILEGDVDFEHALATVSLGAYTVSGTYSIDVQIKQRKGDAFLKSLLHERFSNIASVLQTSGHPGSLIIDRNARWYCSQNS